MESRGPFIVGVGGFSSNVGKTTLMCELLSQLRGWEAIKTTRGHYRSCGKDPHTCCVSHLLSDQPLVRSTRAETYEVGKDTGRYWDAGAANVHWVIATDDQIGSGIRQALSRVRSRAVLIEGNSFSAHVEVDFMLMVAGAEGEAIKRSARSALERCVGIYRAQADGVEKQRLSSLAASLIGSTPPPIYASDDLPKLISIISHLNSKRAA